jgi:hypothetical protein
LLYSSSTAPGVGFDLSVFVLLKVSEIISILLIAKLYVYLLFIYLHHANNFQYIYVGIATAYGLDGPGIESRWVRDFPHLSRPALRPTQPLVRWVFPRGKVQLGHDADPSPPSSFEVENRVELYLYCP